jgi:integrase/recombinase XerD
MITSKNWYEHMSEDMVLKDFRSTTRESYESAIRLFLEWAKVEPLALSEDMVRNYVLYLRENKKLSASSVNVATCALRFFFTYTVPREWPVFELLRVRIPEKLPVVLAPSEARAVLGIIREPVHRMALTTIYGLGLRLNEGIALKVDQIDSARRMVWVRDGKRARDRAIPLPKPLLVRLRRFWKEERAVSPSPYLFIGSRSKKPLDPTGLQRTFVAARRDIKLAKHASIHTLRHSYATFLLEHGVSLRMIQQILGHKSLRSTEVYLHVTQPAMVQVQEVVDRLMADI